MSPHTKIDVGAVLAGGRELDVRDALTVPGFESYAFPEPAQVTVNVRRLGGVLEIVGTADAVAVGACARCLGDVRLPLHLEIDERINPRTGATDPLDESNVLARDELDLGDLVRQLIDSALPMVLHCTEDCQGLCPTCGERRNSCSCAPPSE